MALEDMAREVEVLRHRDLEGLMAEAWRLRQERWPPVLAASTPSPHAYSTREHSNDPARWAQFSVTGRQCALSCEHCGGKVLAMMEEAASPAALVEECRRRLEGGGLEGGGLEGVLVSGGSDPEGRVPLAGYLDAMRELKEMGLEVIVHTGLAGRELAEGLASAGVDLAMTDVIGSREVARSVCHLDRGPEDWHRTLQELVAAGVPIAPHLVAGLDRGRVDSEYTALSIALDAGPQVVVVIVLSPLPGTGMADASPPPPLEVARLGAVARLAGPEVPLALGCVKPSGATRGAIERGMVDAGANTVTYPLASTLEHARARGLGVEFSDVCCALVRGGVTGPP